MVADATGIVLHTGTAWGVGQVMEFYINAGLPGVILGFLVLGWLIGKLDRMSAQALRLRQHGTALVYFLPCVALVQPLGSVVELTGGALAALLAGLVVGAGLGKLAQARLATSPRPVSEWRP